MIESIDVNVVMRSSQSMGTHLEEQERTSSGKMYDRAGARVVKYRDTESDTVDTLEIPPRRVRMKRSGAVCSEMEFAAGESHIFDMVTELGTFNFLLRTGRVAVGIFDDRVTLDLAYDLYSDGSLISHNRVSYVINKQI